ncbi:pentapeptide repeat-containing protein [Streptomyces sp. NPDC047043]|uniref:pentapeptide repeat-containing protein n=1 Tax=Streptomyces sp. NPDC047043 TaxID=3154497 RepID=UPI0033C6A3C5
MDSPDGEEGCTGRAVAPHSECLAHLSDTDRDDYLSSLSAGSRVDHRGTTLDASLLSRLLNAVRDPESGRPRLSAASFSRAVFKGYADFDAAVFDGDAAFNSATFEGHAAFVSATFNTAAGFEETVFQGDARFGSATFWGDAEFRSATFRKSAWFESAVFEGAARFGGSTTSFEGIAGFASATFNNEAEFAWAKFNGHVTFESASFKGDARFESARFCGGAKFKAATFEEYAEFNSSGFEVEADFSRTTFEGSAWFESAVFQDGAEFSFAHFLKDARFASATFARATTFGSAKFAHDTRFDATVLAGDANFTSVVFERTAQLGPLSCAAELQLSDAVFNAPVTINIAACRLVCRRTRWSSLTSVRLRHATADFALAVFEYPLSISAESKPFVLATGRPLDETMVDPVPDGSATVRIVSLHGVDAAHLVLADVDLSCCPFTGIVHLDQLKLEGTCSFAEVPAQVHWQRWRPVRFTARRTLIEEHYWRASQPSAAREWRRDESGEADARPAALAPVYRALRKSFEDSKNEPGAADFYYGEMEMRRHAPEAPRAERSLLAAYWALSGYGLRATRALVWLLLAMTATVLAMTLWGIPAGHGHAKPVVSSGERLDQSLRVVMNSVIFRTSGQNLTTAGTYIEMASRLTEPILLGLAVLAVRGRVKR